MRVLLALGLLGWVGACSLVPPIAALEGASAWGTGKTVSDHVISISSGKNCSTVRREIGRTYCEEDEANPPTTVYCYPTLGEVTCYNRPDPYNDGRQRRVDANDHNLPAKWR